MNVSGTRRELGSQEMREQSSDQRIPLLEEALLEESNARSYLETRLARANNEVAELGESIQVLTDSNSRLKERSQAEAASNSRLAGEVSEMKGRLAAVVQTYAMELQSLDDGL